MNRLSLLALSFVLALSACGQTPPPAPPPSAPMPDAVAPVPPPAAPVAAVESWTDLHKLHEPMEANGDQMKALRTAARAGDLAKALAQAELLAASMKDVRALAQGFNGETPDRFRAFADTAAVEAETYRAALAAATAPGAPAADPAALNAKLETFRATCKSCHDVYKKD